jgi:hypothetical protein
MENLRMKFTPSELGSFTTLLNQQFIRSFKTLTAENYVEYFNLRVILKKCFDKIFKLDKKSYTWLCVSLTPCEIRSLKIIFGINDFLDLPPYELIVVSNFFQVVDKYENSLFFKKSVLSDFGTFDIQDSQYYKKCQEIEKER